jgi:acetyl-CoA synthase
MASHGKVNEVSMYSIMENPMTACGCFECIVMLIPEANGVMVVNREDTSMTPAGMTFSTLAGVAGGGLQTPGVMGVGKYLPGQPKVHLCRWRVQEGCLDEQHLERIDVR